MSKEQKEQRLSTQQQDVIATDYINTQVTPLIAQHTELVKKAITERKFPVAATPEKKAHERTMTLQEALKYFQDTAAALEIINSFKKPNSTGNRATDEAALKAYQDAVDKTLKAYQDAVGAKDLTPKVKVQWSSRSHLIPFSHFEQIQRKYLSEDGQKLLQMRDDLKNKLKSPVELKQLIEFQQKSQQSPSQVTQQQLTTLQKKLQEAQKKQIEAIHKELTTKANEKTKSVWESLQTDPNTNLINIADLFMFIDELSKDESLLQDENPADKLSNFIALRCAFLEMCVIGNCVPDSVPGFDKQTKTFTFKHMTQNSRRFYKLDNYGPTPLGAIREELTKTINILIDFIPDIKAKIAQDAGRTGNNSAMIGLLNQKINENQQIIKEHLKQKLAAEAAAARAQADAQLAHEKEQKAHENAARVLAETGQRKQADDAISKGQVAFQEGHFGEAAGHYRAAIEAAPTYGRAYVLLAKAQMMTNLETAQATLNTGIAKITPAPDSTADVIAHAEIDLVDLYMQQGFIAFLLRDSGAASSLQKALEIHKRLKKPVEILKTTAYLGLFHYNQHTESGDKMAQMYVNQVQGLIASGDVKENAYAELLLGEFKLRQAGNFHKDAKIVEANSAYTEALQHLKKAEDLNKPKKQNNEQKDHGILNDDGLDKGAFIDPFIKILAEKSRLSILFRTLDIAEFNNKKKIPEYISDLIKDYSTLIDFCKNNNNGKLIAKNIKEGSISILSSLYLERGKFHYRQKNWQEALDDYNAFEDLIKSSNPNYKEEQYFTFVLRERAECYFHSHNNNNFFYQKANSDLEEHFRGVAREASRRGIVSPKSESASLLKADILRVWGTGEQQSAQSDANRAAKEADNNPGNQEAQRKKQRLESAFADIKRGNLKLAIDLYAAAPSRHIQTHYYEWADALHRYVATLQVPMQKITYLEQACEKLRLALKESQKGSQSANTKIYEMLQLVSEEYHRVSSELVKTANEQLQNPGNLSEQFQRNIMDMHDNAQGYLAKAEGLYAEVFEITKDSKDATDYLIGATALSNLILSQFNKIGIDNEPKDQSLVIVSQHLVQLHAFCLRLAALDDEAISSNENFKVLYKNLKQIGGLFYEQGALSFRALKVQLFHCSFLARDAAHKLDPQDYLDNHASERGNRPPANSIIDNCRKAWDTSPNDFFREEFRNIGVTKFAESGVQFCDALILDLSQDKRQQIEIYLKRSELHFRLKKYQQVYDDLQIVVQYCNVAENKMEFPPLPRLILAESCLQLKKFPEAQQYADSLLDMAAHYQDKNFQNSYTKLARTLGKRVKQLTDQEVAQAKKSARDELFRKDIGRNVMMYIYYRAEAFRIKAEAALATSNNNDAVKYFSNAIVYYREVISYFDPKGKPLSKPGSNRSQNALIEMEYVTSALCLCLLGIHSIKKPSSSFLAQARAQLKNTEQLVACYHSNNPEIRERLQQLQTKIKKLNEQEQQNSILNLDNLAMHLATDNLAPVNPATNSNNLTSVNPAANSNNLTPVNPAANSNGFFFTEPTTTNGTSTPPKTPSSTQSTPPAPTTPARADAATTNPPETATAGEFKL